MRFVKSNWSPGSMHYVPHHVDIQVKCHGCGTQRPFDRNTLQLRFQHAYIDEIQPRLKCSNCGAKGGEMLFGYYTSEEKP